MAGWMLHDRRRMHLPCEQHNHQIFAVVFVTATAKAQTSHPHLQRRNRARVPYIQGSEPQSVSPSDFCLPAIPWPTSGDSQAKKDSMAMCPVATERGGHPDGGQRRESSLLSRASEKGRMSAIRCHDPPSSGRMTASSVGEAGRPHPCPRLAGWTGMPRGAKQAGRQQSGVGAMPLRSQAIGCGERPRLLMGHVNRSRGRLHMSAGTRSHRHDKNRNSAEFSPFLCSPGGYG